MNFSLDEYEHLRREYPRLLAQIVCGEYFLLSLCESGETPVTRLFSCCIHRKHFLPGGWWKMGEVYERKLLQIKGFTKFRKDFVSFIYLIQNHLFFELNIRYKTMWGSFVETAPHRLSIRSVIT